jgi:hypothetical protein
MVDRDELNNIGTYELDMLVGIPKEKVPAAKTLAYFNNCKIFELEPTPESNGYEWRMKFLAPNSYKGLQMRKIATENGYASYAYEIDYRAREKIKDYIM